MKRILITGGHVTPAIAVIGELQKRKTWDIYYIGRRHALEGDRALSAEFRLISQHGIPFLPITTGRLQRTFTPFTIVSLLKIPIGFVQSLFYLLKTRPDVLLSFGGYVALPVVVSAWLLRIPIVTHEQTMVTGLANRIIGFFAQKVCISWPQTANTFSSKKVQLTGNPVRPELFTQTKNISIPLDRPIIYITGGSLGAHAINRVVGEALPKLLEHYTLIHQTGNSASHADFRELTDKKNQLSPHLQKRYHVYEFIDVDMLGWIYKHASAMISRCGANTITEIIAFTRPALLIPFPYSGEGEQEANASHLVSHDASIMLLQKDLTAMTLISKLSQVLTQKDALRTNLQKLARTLPPHPEVAIADSVESV